ncbi:MAG: hypothetical protein IKU35_06560 [Bacteroidaceae bacterium]|nr:hypothetical protein [Bacteroidaceae bacterium]
MEQYFATKTDANGNRFVLYINHGTKRFTVSCFLMVHKSDITATVTRKKMREICFELKENGYTEYIKL